MRWTLIAVLVGILASSVLAEDPRRPATPAAAPRNKIDVSRWIQWLLMRSRVYNKESKWKPAVKVQDPVDDFEDLDFDETNNQQQQNKRQVDDYGHMRYGKREFDDYGHMRFGKR